MILSVNLFISLNNRRTLTKLWAFFAQNLVTLAETKATVDPGEVLNDQVVLFFWSSGDADDYEMRMDEMAKMWVDQKNKNWKRPKSFLR